MKLRMKIKDDNSLLNAETPTDRASDASHPVVIVLCIKLNAECNRQATVVGRLLTTLNTTIDVPSRNYDCIECCHGISK